MNSPTNVDRPEDDASDLATESDGRLVTRNFSVLMASQFVTWVLSLAAIVVIPRYLGAELLGRLHIANSLWAIGFVVASFGMDLLLTKEAARDHSRVGSLLGTSIAVRLVFFVPVAASLFGYAVLAGYPRETLGVLAVIGGASLALTVTAAVTAVLQGLERMGAIAVAAVVGRVVFVGGALAFLLAGYSIYAVAAFSVLGNVVSLLLHVRALRRLRAELGIESPITFNPASVRAMVRESVPYFGVGFFVVLYLQIDAVVISLVVESEEVLGWYSVYDRLAGTLLFVPTVFIAAVYPTLSRLHATAPGGHARLTQKSFELMLIISVPVGLGLAVIARPLVEILFGSEFSEAAPVLAIGGVVTSMTYLTTVLGMFLISMDRQRELTRVIAVAALLTIPLDLVLVPFFQSHFDNGAMGGAVAYLITESIVLSGTIFLLPRGSLGSSTAWFVLRVVLAGGVMVAAIAPLRDLPLVLPITAGAIVYTLAAIVMRVVAREDRELFMSYLPGARRAGGQGE